MPSNEIDWQVLYILATVLAILLTAGFVAFAWRFRHSEAGTWLLLTMVVAVGWSTLVLLMAVLPTSVTSVLLNVKYLLIGLAPIALVRVVLDLTGVVRQYLGRITLVLLLIPLTTQLVLWNPQWTSAMLKAVQFDRVGILTYPSTITFGPLYWLGVGQGYLLTVGSIVMLLVASRSAPPVYRTQLLWVGLAIVTPVITNALLITRIAPRQYDPMPFGLMVMVACVWWALLRHRLLELVPLARNRLVDAIPDCIILTDDKGRIVDANAPMCQLLNAPLGQLLVHGLPEFERPRGKGSASLQAIRTLITNPQEASDASSTTEHLITIDERTFAVRCAPLNLQDRGADLRLLTLSDVTARRRAELELEQSHHKLEEALRQVKTLSGLLPMCSGCKKIRDRIGGWQTVEDYISAHSDAMLTHGVCPDCQARMYSGYLGDPGPGNRQIGSQQ